MRIRSAPSGLIAIKDVVLAEDARLVVVVIPGRVVPPWDLVASLVLPQRQLQHLGSVAVVLPLELARVGVLVVEWLRVLALLLAVGEHDVDVVGDVRGGELGFGSVADCDLLAVD